MPIGELLFDVKLLAPIVKILCFYSRYLYKFLVKFSYGIVPLTSLNAQAISYAVSDLTPFKFNLMITPCLEPSP